MGKATGFLDYARADCERRGALARVADFGEFHAPLPAAERRRQAARCMDCGTPFCQSGIVFDGRPLGCPLHNLIPEWNDLLWRDAPERALERLIKVNCFPEFTGRVCPAPCEAGCTLGMTGEPVTIRDNELDIIERAFESGLMKPRPPAVRSGRSAAIIGSGPAGLAAAYWLNRRGHGATVFERDPEPGGLLMYGIPSMKLPKDIVRRRAELMQAEGVTFKTNVNVGKDITPERLANEFDCVICCCGAQKPRELEFEGEARGAGYALDYLKNSDGELCARGRRIVVVGAGDSASDCIATAIRQGAAQIRQLIRKSREFYKGAPDYAREEANAVYGRDIREFETRVVAVRASAAGELCALRILSPDGERELEAERLIIASGFSGSDAGFEPPDAPNVLTAGDMAGGSSLVALAIADGSRAAQRAERLMLG